jgi:hypothetical protein
VHDPLDGPLRSFLERYWFAVALSIGIIIWALRTRRRVRGASQRVPRPRPPSGSVGPVPLRGVDFAAKVAIVQRFHTKTIGAMIVFGLLSLAVFAVPGLPRGTRMTTAIAAGIGAVVSWLALAIREGPLLRRLGLYCPQCGNPLVGGAENEVAAQIVVGKTGRCRCGAWLLDPADLPSGQGPDESYLPAPSIGGRALP